MGQSFFPIVFELQGLAGGQFLLHFDKLIARRAEKIGALIAPLKIHSWSRRLSLMLQRNVAHAINIRMTITMLYTGPTTEPTAAVVYVDESVFGHLLLMRCSRKRLWGAVNK